MLPTQTLTFDLRCRTADFGKALRKLGRALPKRKGEQAVLSYDGAMLHVELGGGTIVIPAEGRADAQVRVAGAALLRLPRVLPREQSLRLRAIDYRLWLGPCSLPCAIQPAWSNVVDLPAGMTTEQALRTLLEEDFEDIEASGLAPYVKANQKTLMRVIEKEMKEQGLLDFNAPGNPSYRW